MAVIHPALKPNTSSLALFFILGHQAEACCLFLYIACCYNIHCMFGTIRSIHCVAL